MSVQGCIPCTAVADLPLRRVASKLTPCYKACFGATTVYHLRHGARCLEITGDFPHLVLCTSMTWAVPESRHLLHAIELSVAGSLDLP